MSSSTRSGIQKCGNRFKASHRINCVEFFVGLFDTEEEAIHAYDLKLQSLHSLGLYQSPKERSAGFAGRNEVDNGRASSPMMTTETGKLAWERLVCIYQRLLLATATRAKLMEAQLDAPDYHKDAMVKSLNEEIVILGIAKSQLEHAVCLAFAEDIVLEQIEMRSHDGVDKALLSTDSSQDIPTLHPT